MPVIRKNNIKNTYPVIAERFNTLDSLVEHSLRNLIEITYILYLALDGLYPKITTA